MGGHVASDPPNPPLPRGEKRGLSAQVCWKPPLGCGRSPHYGFDVRSDRIDKIDRMKNPSIASRVVPGSQSPYHGTVLLSEGIRRNLNAVCGLTTTYASRSTLLAFELGTNGAFARKGGRETTNGTWSCGLHRSRVMRPRCEVRRPAHNKLHTTNLRQD